MSVQNFLKSVIHKIYRLVNGLLLQLKDSPTNAMSTRPDSDDEDAHPPVMMAAMSSHRGGSRPSRPKPFRRGGRFRFRPWRRR